MLALPPPTAGSKSGGRPPPNPWHSTLWHWGCGSAALRCIAEFAFGGAWAGLTRSPCPVPCRLQIGATCIVLAALHTKPFPPARSLRGTTPGYHIAQQPSEPYCCEPRRSFIFLMARQLTEPSMLPMFPPVAPRSRRGAVGAPDY